MSAPTSPVSAEEAVAYFRSHGLQKTERRVGRKIWEPLLLEMIEDFYSLDEIIAWISEHHKALGYKQPADITVRDWISQIRKERDMPLRRPKAKSAAPAQETEIQSSQPEAPAAAAAPTAKTPDPEPKPNTPAATVPVAQNSPKPPQSPTAAPAPEAKNTGLPENKKGEVDWTGAPISEPPPKNMKQSGYRRYWDTQFIGRKSFLETQRKRICDEIPNGNERGDILLVRIEQTPKTATTANDYATRIADLNVIYRSQPDASVGDFWVSTMINAFIEFTEA